LRGCGEFHESVSTLDQGTHAPAILDHAPVAAMDEVVGRFSTGVFFVPEMLRKTTGSGIERPEIGNQRSEDSGQRELPERSLNYKFLFSMSDMHIGL
jgi:hypothetical protein